MAIRPARTTEADALDRVAMAAKEHWGYSAQDLARWAKDLSTPPDTIAAWPTLVAESEEAVVGFMQLCPNSHPWELVSLWVHPEHMGKGIGRELLREAIATAVSAGQRHIHIDADPNALGFYLACGAKQVATVPAPTSSEPDRVRPQLELVVSGA
jgi:ribosomal protein S18 acetylase RimI-like enzyme